MKQIEQNYRTGEMRLIDAPVPLAGKSSSLVSTAVSLISAGTEKQIVALAKSSLARKAIARPDLVRQTIRKAKSEGLAATFQKVMGKLNTPIPLGYSLAGTIVEPEPGSGYSTNDRVACAGAAIANHAEFNVVPRNLAIRIPEGVSDDDASFITLGAIALQGVRVTNPTLGERVVVIGLGLIGLLTIQILKANGCRVLGVDPNPDRVALAKEMGADVAMTDAVPGAVRNFTGGHGADAVIITASTKSSDPLNQAAELSRMKGRVVVVGLVGMDIDREPFYKRELDLRLSMSYGPGRYDPIYEEEGVDYPLPYVRWTEGRNMQAFLELIQSGQVTPSRLVTHRFPIEKALDAYALMESDEPYLAILLDYDGTAQTERAVAVGHSDTSSSASSGDRAAFIGMGNYAKSVLLPAYRKAGGPPLRTVTTATGLSAVNAAEQLGFSKAATDPAEVFADEAIGTVFITTRHDTHANLIVRALEAGKNVFVEKPLALTLDELEQVSAAHEQARGLLLVGFNRRFSPMIERARRELGESSGPLSMSYRVNAGFIPSESWVHGAQGGGRIIGETCHFIDTMCALCGGSPRLIGVTKPAGIPDSVTASFQFSDGSVGSLVYATRGDPALTKERLEIFAEGMAIEIDDFSQMRIHRRGKTATVKSKQDKGQERMLEAFFAALADGGPSPIPFAEMGAISRATFAMEGFGQ